LNLGLVQGAHIYPASAPGSIDHVTNGLALCANHHLMCDQHKLWVHPASRAIAVHPAMAGAEAESASAQFVARTQPRLSAPRDSSHVPQQAMFERRYEYFTGLYAWAS
jgi:predicted restriction endonuclease